MKRKAYLMFLLVAFVATMSSCRMARDKDSNQKVEEVRTVAYFDGIEVTSNCNVHYIQSHNSFSVRVVGDSAAVKSIRTKSVGGTLMIASSNKYMSGINLFEKRIGTVDVYITSPDLINVTLRGSGDFESNGLVDTDTLGIFLSGSGDIDFKNIVCDKLVTNLKGCGDIDISQLTCQNSSLSLVGTGDLCVTQKNVEHSDIELKGVGDIDVRFINCNSATCKLMGVGDISLSGNIKSLTKQIMGTGDIDLNKLSVGRNNVTHK